MTLDDLEQLIAVHDNPPRGEDYPECRRCHSFMETAQFDDEATSFCATCIYNVADDLARAVLAMLPVVRAADNWLEHLERHGGRYLDGVPGELCDAIDTMRTRLTGGAK